MAEPAPPISNGVLRGHAAAFVAAGLCALPAVRTAENPASIHAALDEFAAGGLRFYGPLDAEPVPPPAALGGRCALHMRAALEVIGPGRSNQ